MDIQVALRGLPPQQSKAELDLLQIGKGDAEASIPLAYV